jgi:hypothetical protein
LNVISLINLNGTIPLIAVQMQAYKVGEYVTLVFTTVLDEMPRGLVEGDEIEQATPASREYWESRASKATVAIADQLLGIAKEFDPGIQLKYNRFYIGIAKNDRANNFVSFVPRKNTFTLQLKVPQVDETEKNIQDQGLELMGYDKQFGNYNIRLGIGDASQHRAFLQDVMKQAYDLRNR